MVYDPCYHQVCDNSTPVEDSAYVGEYAAINAAYPGKLVGNLNTQMLDEIPDAVAQGTLTFAQTTSDTNDTEKSSGTPSSSKSQYKGSRLIRCSRTRHSPANVRGAAFLPLPSSI